MLFTRLSRINLETGLFPNYRFFRSVFRPLLILWQPPPPCKNQYKMKWFLKGSSRDRYFSFVIWFRAEDSRKIYSCSGLKVFLFFKSVFFLIYFYIFCFWVIRVILLFNYNSMHITQCTMFILILLIFYCIFRMLSWIGFFIVFLECLVGLDFLLYF